MSDGNKNQLQLQFTSTCTSMHQNNRTRVYKSTKVADKEYNTMIYISDQECIAIAYQNYKNALESQIRVQGQTRIKNHTEFGTRNGDHENKIA